MARHDPGWEDRLRAGDADVLLGEMRPLVSHIMVRPFVEAYRIVADVLVNDDVAASTEDSEVTSRALGLGHQYVAQRRLRSSESVSVLLFQTGLQLARNRGLLGSGSGSGSDAGAGAGSAGGGAELAGSGADLAARRADFLAGLRHLVRRLDRIEDLAIRRYIRDAVSVLPAD
jgi:glycerol-3-phosphate O-acyltransferase